MKVAIIIGSHRAESQSSKVGHYIAEELKKSASETYVFDLRKNPLPLWDESIWAGDENWKSLWGPVSTELTNCDAAVIISPEWGGMVPAGLKNFFLLLGKEMAHKPALIVGVSSSRGGSYPVSELRQSSFKNTFICYIPDHVIVRDVEKVLNPGPSSGADDEFIRSKIAYSLQILTLYSQGLSIVRESGKLDFKSFPFGM